MADDGILAGHHVPPRSVADRVVSDNPPTLTAALAGAALAALAWLVDAAGIDVDVPAAVAAAAAIVAAAQKWVAQRKTVPLWKALELRDGHLECGKSVTGEQFGDWPDAEAP